MRKLFTVLTFVLIASASGVFAQRTVSPADATAIRETALNHIEGSYEGNAEHMERKLLYTGEQSIDGDWVGPLTVGSYWAFVKIHFEIKKDKVEGTLDVPRERVTRLPFSPFRFDSSRVRFEAQPIGESGAWIFDGRLRNGSISGIFEFRGERGPFQLVRYVQVDSKIYDQYIGDYRLGPNKYISIARHDPGDGEDYLTYLDFESGHWGLLYPLSDTTFYFGPARVASFPLDLKITFIKKNGKATSLRWSRSTLHQQKFAQRVEFYKEEAVTFQNRDVRLSGTLLMPLGPGPHPAVVIVHGSGAQTRNGSFASPNYLRFIADNFARHGIAALIYDKRGVGASTGDWNRATFEDLADDVLSGVQLLKNRSDIDPKQIGLWGISQVGWIIPSAASRSTDVAFVIVVGVAGVTPADQELYRRKENLRVAGFSEADIQEALTHQKLKFELVRRNQPKDLDAANEQAKNEKWFPYVSNPTRGQSWVYWRNVINVDPLPDWERFAGPVLLISGALDESSPPESLANIEQALRKGGNKDHTSKVFPKADHLLLVKPTKSAADDYPHLATGYLRVIIEWLLKRVDVER